MIRAHVFNWITCRWEWLWRPATMVRAMRHLTFGSAIVCTGITVWPPAPPTEAHPPAPPVYAIPPPPAWPAPPPAWGYIPGDYVPAREIPLGPVIEAPPLRETEEAPGIELADLCVPPGHEVPCFEVVPSSPKQPVPEPAGLFFLAIVVLGIWKAIPMDGSR